MAGALSAAAAGRLPEALADTMMAPEGSVGPAGGADLPQMEAVKRVGKVTGRLWTLLVFLPYGAACTVHCCNLFGVVNMEIRSHIDEEF